MKITRQTTIYAVGCESTPIQYALKSLMQDMARIFGQTPLLESAPSPNQIRIALTPDDRVESFRLKCDTDQDYVLIEGSDDLGVVFGLYTFCETWLGVDPYQFWTDYPCIPRDEISLPAFETVSPEPQVRFRGWFINDEDCLMGWHDEMQVSLATWEHIFETMLRAGFNMVIPGTVVKPDAPQLQLASDMGLWLTQHHAEPLGAALFSDVYPGVQPRLPEDLDRFTALYSDSIQRQKRRKVVWALGFRGQGDHAFFKTDTRYDTPQKRGKVITDMIRHQKHLVETLTDEPHHFVHYLYSESAALYRDGHLDLDDDVIRVWSDNGFGAMRARREWETDPHIVTLPLAIDKDKTSGVYYHLSFHDLQLSSKLTPLVAPTLIHDQFRQLFEAGNIAYLSLNVSNIRPHLFNIDLIRKLVGFPDTHFDSTGHPVDQHYMAWTHKYFPGHERDSADLIARYHQTPFRYGVYPDDLAGESLCHHGLRHAISAVIARENALDWPFTFHYIPANAVTTTAACLRWLLERAETTLPLWRSLQVDAEALGKKLDGYAARYFSDSVRMQIHYMAYSYDGLAFGLRGLLAYEAQDYKEAFCLISQSKWAMENALETLLTTEHGKWIHFYRGEWLTGTRETIRRLETLHGLCKIMGEKDGCISTWIPEAMGISGQSAIHTIVQAHMDYDTLARALLARKQGAALDNPSSLLVNLE